MNTHTIFDFSRFGRLFLKEISDNRRMIFKGVILTSFLVGLLYSVVCLTKEPYDFFFVNKSEGTFFRMFFIFAFVGNVAALSQKIENQVRRIYYLNFPATIFEKYLSSFFYTLIVLPVCIAVSMLAGNYIGTFIMGFFVEGPLFAFNPVLYFQSDGQILSFGGFILWMLGAHSFFFLCSYIWAKKTFLKAFMAGILLSLLFVLVTILTVDSPSVFFLSNLQYLRWAGIVMIPVNWSLAFFRLKELEVVESKK